MVKIKEETKVTVITAGLNLIPYVGGSLGTIYSSVKAHKERERLEKFYSDVASGVERLEEKLSEALKNSHHDEEYLSMLIEKTSRKVEREAREIKQQAFRIFFTNALLNGVNETTYHNDEFYLDALDSLSEIDIQLLGLLRRENRRVEVSEINSTGFNDPYFILATVNKLRNLGFVEAYTGDFHINGGRDNALGQNIKLSSLGEDFISFCLD